MKKILGMAIVSAVLFSSCKKDDECNLTDASLVGTYKLTGLTYRLSPQAAEENVFSTFTECERDNVFIFNADHTLYYQDAGVICNPPQNDQGVWALNGSTLTFDGETNTVASFDCKTMVTQTRDVSFNGDVLTATYVKL
jgi:hypothetical protein